MHRSPSASSPTGAGAKDRDRQAAFPAQYRDVRDDAGHLRVVRGGGQPTCVIPTGSGDVPVGVLQVHDRAGAIRFGDGVAVLRKRLSANGRLIMPVYATFDHNAGLGRARCGRCAATFCPRVAYMCNAAKHQGKTCQLWQSRVHLNRAHTLPVRLVKADLESKITEVLAIPKRLKVPALRLPCVMPAAKPLFQSSTRTSMSIYQWLYVSMGSKESGSGNPA